MLGFVIGTLVGGTFGVTALCLFQAASAADRYLEDCREERLSLRSEKRRAVKPRP